MKHRFWREMFWDDYGHCKCCPCGKGAYPINGQKEGNGTDVLIEGQLCVYGVECKPYSRARLFVEQIKGFYVAWKEEHYEDWVKYRRAGQGR